VNNKTRVRSAFHSPEVSNKGNSPLRRTITHLITRKPDDFFQIELARKKRKEPENQSINELFVLFESDNCRDDWIAFGDPYALLLTQEALTRLRRVRFVFSSAPANKFASLL
jgi:hypothetical protein